MDKAQEEKSEKLIREALKSFQIKAEKTWALKKIKFPISILVGNLEEEKWKNVKKEIIKYKKQKCNNEQKRKFKNPFF